MVFSAHSRCLWHFYSFQKSRKTVAPQSEIGNLAGLELQGQFVSDEGNKLRVSRFSLGIADGIAEKSLQRIQVASVPGNFDGMSNGSLHSGRGGLEGLCHLGVFYIHYRKGWFP